MQYFSNPTSSQYLGIATMNEQLERVRAGSTVDTSKSAIKASLSFLGNAAAHFSVERRKAPM